MITVMGNVAPALRGYGKNCGEGGKGGALRHAAGRGCPPPAPQHEESRADWSEAWTPVGPPGATRLTPPGVNIPLSKNLSFLFH